MFMPPTKTQISVTFLKKITYEEEKYDVEENFDEEENIIIGGDFNCPLNPNLDKKGGVIFPRKSVVTIEILQEELDLVDIWRVNEP